MATENVKVSNWLVSKPVAREEGNPVLKELIEMKMEIEVESNQPSITVLERRLKRDGQKESWWSTKMCRELVLGLIGDVPGSAMADVILNRVAQQVRRNDSRRQAEGRLLVGRLLSGLVDGIPGLSATTPIMDMMVWRAGVNGPT